jgi:hypothetical protein
MEYVNAHVASLLKIEILWDVLLGNETSNRNKSDYGVLGIYVFSFFV